MLQLAICMSSCYCCTMMQYVASAVDVVVNFRVPVLWWRIHALDVVALWSMLLMLYMLLADKSVNADIQVTSSGDVVPCCIICHCCSVAMLYFWKMHKKCFEQPQSFCLLNQETWVYLIWGYWDIFSIYFMSHCRQKPHS